MARRFGVATWGRLVLAVLLICACLAQLTLRISARAQSRADARWTHFTQAADGLISNDVWSLAADSTGVWFGTAAGVGRYDGGWTAIVAGAVAAKSQESANNLLFERVLTLMPYGGGITAGTERGAVLDWDGEAWQKIAAVGAPVRVLLRTPAELLIGTDNGLYRLHGQLLRWDEVLGAEPVYALATSEDDLLAGTADGLYRRTNDNWSKTDSRFFDAGVYALVPLGEDGLAVGTPTGLVYQRSRSESWQLVETYDEYGKAVPVRAIAQAAPARLWVGTDGGGASSIDLESQLIEGHGFTGDPNLPTHYVRAIAIDRDGSVWFATPVGVFRFQETLWTSHLRGATADAPINHVNDILVDSRDQVWIATGGGGVMRKDTATGQEKIYGRSAGVPETVLVLGEGGSGEVWAGTFEGVFRYTHGAWTSPIASDQLPSRVVTYLQVDGRTMWIGTEAGLVAFDVASETTRPEPALDGISIEALALDNLARLWVGTTNEGVYRREATGEWRRFRYDPAEPSGLPGNRIVGGGLAADPGVSGGMYAIVQQEGLYHWDGVDWHNADPDRRLPSNLLWTVETEAGSGALWVGSEAGATRTDGRTWNTLTADDGLQSAVVYAIARDPAGGYWLGGSTGLSYWRPDQTPPWVRLLRVTGNDGVEWGGALRVARGRELSIDYNAGDLQTDRAKLLVQSRVVGPSQTAVWQDTAPGSLRIKLDAPGEYWLELLARDQSFNYSTVASQAIHVVDPPPAVHVPLLGMVAANTFRTLVALASMVVVGSAYLSVEILRNRRRGIEAVNRGYNPYISGEPVRRDDMFFGRRELVQRMAETLHNNSIMIHGERRIGKTTLLHQLAAVLRDCDDPEYWFVPIYVDLEGTPEETFFHYLIEEIWEAATDLPDVAADLGPVTDTLRFSHVAPKAYNDRLFGRDLRRIADALQTYGEAVHPGKQMRIVLLLDEMDVMSRYDHIVQQQLRRMFMRDFASTLGAVVAGIRISKEWERVESPWYNLFNEIAVEPFSREQALELLIEPVRGFYRFEPAAVDFILDQSQGRPYKVQQYGLEAVSHMLAHRRRKITRDDVLAAHERIQKALEEEQAERKRAKAREVEASEATNPETDADRAEEMPKVPATD